MKHLLQVLCVGGVVCFSGCTLVDWSKETFPQVQSYNDSKEILKNYLRSVVVYDQFTTVAIFDALWLSDDIKTLYTDTYAAMHGRTPEVRKTFLRRQLKENSEFVSFYVLSTHDIPLNAKPAPWSVYLKIGEKTYQPLEIKMVELLPEYGSFFGKKLSSHKDPYEVKFERKDGDGKDIFAGAKTIQLYFSGPNNYVFMHWNVKKEQAFLAVEEPVVAAVVATQEAVAVPTEKIQEEVITVPVETTQEEPVAVSVATDNSGAQVTE